MQNTRVINNTLWGAIGLLAVATVAQVWVLITPAVADIQAKQTSAQDDIKYIRERVDALHDKLDKH